MDFRGTLFDMLDEFTIKRIVDEAEYLQKRDLSILNNEVSERIRRKEQKGIDCPRYRKNGYLYRETHFRFNHFNHSELEEIYNCTDWSGKECTECNTSMLTFRYFFAKENLIGAKHVILSYLSMNVLNEFLKLHDDNGFSVVGHPEAYYLKNNRFLLVSSPYADKDEKGFLNYEGKKIYRIYKDAGWKKESHLYSWNLDTYTKEVDGKIVPPKYFKFMGDNAYTTYFFVSKVFRVLQSKNIVPISTLKKCYDILKKRCLEP